MFKRREIGLLLVVMLCGCSEWRKQQYEGYTEFHNAAKAGDVDELKRLLDQGADIDQRSRSAQCTALGCAVRWKKHAAAQFLLEQGAKTSLSFRVASIRYTPFQAAARNGDERMVRLFLPYLERIDEGMDGIYQTGNRSAFTWACSLDDLKLAEFLLESGANINVRNWNYEGTPLILAVKDLRIDVVRFLLENGADADLTDHQRNLSALGWANAMLEGKFISLSRSWGKHLGHAPAAEELEEARRVHADIVALIKAARSASNKITVSE
ncbi:ankyrin repeat domain-containing protein [Pontiella sp.]|uniref:ankyrin repeat domain-containing protein n=1 Tax=Pontiella sp. TaxID=2837462 RepID=UPI003564A03A